MQSIKRFLARRWWFIVLLIAASSVFFSNLLKDYSENKNSVFAVDNISLIDQIEIKQKQSSISICKTDEYWIVNQDFKANPNAIDALFRVISRINASSPVPLAVNDSLVKIIQDQGLKINILTNNKTIKSYWIYNTSTLNLGSIGLISGSSQAYRLELPAYVGNLADLFRTEVTYWQSSLISIPNRSTVTAIEVEIPGHIENSYRIDINEDKDLRLYSVYEGVFVQDYDSVKLNEFVDGFWGITYKQIESNISNSQKRMVISSQPDFSYTFFINDGSRYTMKIFPIPVEEYTDDLGRTINFDLNRVYVSQSNDTNLYIVNYLDLYQIAKDISQFNPK